jgi:hypothetical protein
MRVRVTHWGILSLAVLLLSITIGCMFRGHTPQVPIDDALASPPATGTGSIIGEVRIKTSAGEVRTGAESTIYLIPATAYTSEWFEHYVVKREKIDGKDPRSFLSTRAEHVDGQGRFEFSNIPAGAYYLTCRVYYKPPGLRIGRLSFGLGLLQSVDTYATIDIGPAQNVEVLVTRPTT